MDYIITAGAFYFFGYVIISAFAFNLILIVFGSLIPKTNLPLRNKRTYLMIFLTWVKMISANLVLLIWLSVSEMERSARILWGIGFLIGFFICLAFTRVVVKSYYSLWNFNSKESI